MYDDQYDDNLIIHAYDKSMKLINDKVNDLIKNESKDADNNKSTKLIKENGFKEETSKATKPNDLQKKKETVRKTKDKEIDLLKKWKLGDYCQAFYKEDGKLYEAEIISIDDKNGLCTVKYFGYLNKEEQKLIDLKESAGEENRRNQERQFLEDLEDAPDNLCSFDDQEPINNLIDGKIKSQLNSRINHTTSANLLIPPPPLNLPKSTTFDEDELLQTTLLSWYMSGYHTGYYQAIKDLKRT